MLHTHTLVNMKRSKADREKSMDAAVPAPEAPRYPWGLSLSLDNEVLEKLGLDDLPEVDDELELVARVTVTRVSSADQAEGGPSRDVGLQITEMALEAPKRRKSTADVLYRGKD